MKKGLLIFISFVLAFNAFSQLKKDDFKTKVINKKVKDYELKIKLDSPVNSFISLYYLRSEGKVSKYRDVYTYRTKGNHLDSDYPDLKISEEQKNQLLNTHITEVIYYKDSVACIISPYMQSMYLITYFSKEKGKWLCAGEDLGADKENARENFMSKANNFLDYLHKIIELSIPPKNHESFIKYLHKKAKDPIDFILNKLNKHRLVIYGEVHRRKSSWDFLKKVINHKDFAKKTGTIFMELSCDKQKTLNQFFQNKVLKPDLILDIFREMQLSGWYDKGMYEFLIELWHVNQKLDTKDKIRVFAVDEARPFNQIKNREDYKIYSDTTINRNERMVAIISQKILINPQKRNHLFIVGMAHAYKSMVPGIATGKRDHKPTAGAMLKKILSDKQVYTIFPHTKIISNIGNDYGFIRHGVFDKAFKKFGNKPIAFDLRKSPFGEEPFDGIHEVSYDKRIGKYKDNFDGYLFFGPLDKEKGEYLLYELFTDEFILELKRRAAIFDIKLKQWFNVKKATKEILINKYKEKHQTLRWAN